MNICKRQTFIGKKYQTFNKKVSQNEAYLLHIPRKYL